MYYDKFDIITAYYAFFCDYHEGQWSEKYTRLCHIRTYFTPGMAWKGYESLTENGRAIYDNLAGAV